jgi:hypothetical protein
VQFSALAAAAAATATELAVPTMSLDSHSSAPGAAVASAVMYGEPSADVLMRSPSVQLAADEASSCTPGEIQQAAAAARPGHRQQDQKEACSTLQDVSSRPRLAGTAMDRDAPSRLELAAAASDVPDAAGTCYWLRVTLWCEAAETFIHASHSIISISKHL